MKETTDIKRIKATGFNLEDLFETLEDKYKSYNQTNDNDKEAEKNVCEHNETDKGC